MRAIRILTALRDGRDMTVNESLCLTAAIEVLSNLKVVGPVSGQCTVVCGVVCNVTLRTLGFDVPEGGQSDHDKQGN